MKAWCAALLLAGLSSAHAARPPVQWRVEIAPTASFGDVFLGNVVDVSRSMVVDAAGDLVVAGGDSNCMFVAKLSATDGAVRWRRQACPENGVFWSYASSVALDSRGDVVVGGNFGANVRIAKHSGADGMPIWSREIDLGIPAGVGLEDVFAVALDANGHVFATANAYTQTATNSRLFKLDGSTGATLWSVPAERLAGPLAITPEGDAIVAGNVVAPDGSEWAVARYAGGDGALGWRTLTSHDLPALPNAIALDGHGGVYAAGAAGGTALGRSELMLLRYDAGTGAVQWRAGEVTTAFSSAYGIAVDASGDAYISGELAGRTIVARHRRSDGSTAWRQTDAARTGERNWGLAIALDPAGDVVVAGSNRIVPSAGQATLRMLKYTSSGERAWALSFDASDAFAGDFATDVAVGRDATFVGGWVGTGAGRRLSIWKIGPGSAPAQNVQGLWWASPAGAESGWGMNVVHQGELAFATLFVYDATGRPTWFVAPELENVHDEVFTGPLYETSGPAFSAMPYDSSRVTTRQVGSVRLYFAPDARRVADIGYSVDGRNVQRTLTRQDIASPVPACTEGSPTAGTGNYTDLWWASPPGSESGWGLNLVHQGDVVFATWFTYDANGRPTWFVASDLRPAGPRRFAGTLYRNAGTHFAIAWDPSRLAVTPVGQASVEFADGLRGTFDYTVDGVSRRKAIERQQFASPGTRCQ